MKPERNEDTALSKPGLCAPVRFVRHPSAKRYILGVTRDGVVKVTVPRGGTIAEGRRLMELHADWIKRQLAERAALEKRRRLAAGDTILFRGEYHVLNLVCEDDGYRVVFADQSVTVFDPAEDLRGVVESHLWRLARGVLPARVRELAERVGVQVQKVVVRNQKSRWGSCSPRGTISLNWRLVQAPGWVCDYLIYHELVHLRKMNHSRQFWSLVDSVCPWRKRAEQWLKRKSGELFDGLRRY
ncbi:MAG: M48 family metallopeptidase [Verrucomicrobiae bacterium]|nr:M48 family metallopeptidase [Verrucomicrobiae bacterium]